MLKSNKFWMVIFAVLVLICAVGAQRVWFAGTIPGSAAYVYLDGELVKSINLTTVPGSRTITVYAGSNRTDITNVIEAERGRIRMLDASCDGKDCMRQGWISGEGVPIVCLPNNVVVRIEGRAEIDGVVGG